MIFAKILEKSPTNLQNHKKIRNFQNVDFGAVQSFEKAFFVVSRLASKTAKVGIQNGNKYYM